MASISKGEIEEMNRPKSKIAKYREFTKGLQPRVLSHSTSSLGSHALQKRRAHLDMGGKFSPNSAQSKSAMIMDSSEKLIILGSLANCQDDEQTGERM
jgi:hypothetical protein